MSLRSRIERAEAEIARARHVAALPTLLGAIKAMGAAARRILEEAIEDAKAQGSGAIYPPLEDLGGSPRARLAAVVAEHEAVRRAHPTATENEIAAELWRRRGSTAGADGRWVSHPAVEAGDEPVSLGPRDKQ